MSGPIIPIPELELSKLPISDVKDFIPYFASQRKKPVSQILEPFTSYENDLRKIFAQAPEHPMVSCGKNPNLVPVFAGHETQLKIHARNLSVETEEEKEKYLMTLKTSDRKQNGSPALVSSLKEFQKNFNLFSESSLSDLRWDNVVAAGSAVTTALLPVPEKWAGSKKSLREYYHEKLAPASDVDLFMYGLTEEQAVEKIKQIERSIKDSLLVETTTIRTKNAITIASQYPTRHVQIVLRLYDSISQIITGFDVDCACAAYDGNQVYASPRALAAFATQCNTIDLTRRSPSYENRLSKYSHRGFEVHWPQLERSRIDPTIFERSFGRTLGLSRLLVLEHLPKETDRDAYLDKRRRERGRPAANRNWRNQRRIWGNIKEIEEDDVPDWQVDDQSISDYHTMCVPYGKKFTAAKINRLLYSKDLLLNAEWNKPKEREVHLHRHPCFFGDAADIMEDCCGFCPQPKTDEEIEAAAEEAKIYISGRIAFIKDDPGRQEIGSFNPITTEDWTEMAYVGNTQMLNQAILDDDVDYIETWCKQEGNDVNTRDYVGRTPLHLAVMAGSIKVVQLLIDNDARMVARLIDGRTSLHLASQSGRTDAVDALMKRSLYNAEREEEKLEAKRLIKKEAARVTSKDGCEVLSDSEDSDGETLDDSSHGDIMEDCMTQGSYVKIENDKGLATDALEDDDDDPDVYDINVVAWDTGATPLHYAIIGGHLETIRLLVEEYGADALLPIKIPDLNRVSTNQAILSLVLAIMAQPEEVAREVVKLLLELGASSTQADSKQRTVLQYFVAKKSNLIDVLFITDAPAAIGVLNHVSVGRYGGSSDTPLTIAVKRGYTDLVKKLLKLGARPQTNFDEWLPSYLRSNEHAIQNSTEANMSHFKQQCSQPVILAALIERPEILKLIINAGVDPSTYDTAAHRALEFPFQHYQQGKTLLDHVNDKLEHLNKYTGEFSGAEIPEKLNEDDEHYLVGLEAGSFQHFVASGRLREKRAEVARAKKRYDEDIQRITNTAGIPEKWEAVKKMIKAYEDVKVDLITAGGKTFKELHPDMGNPNSGNQSRYNTTSLTIEPYQTNFTVDLPDLNAQKLEGYKTLFEAVWRNDSKTVRALTLDTWKASDGTEWAPLKVAVQQGSVHMQKNQWGNPYEVKLRYFSPFSVAILRGHYHLASLIVEICQAQFQPKDQPSFQKRWLIDTDDSDEDESDDESGSPQIYSEIVTDTFTIEDITTVSNLVKSHTRPLSMIQWSCSCQWFQEESGEHSVVKTGTDLLDYAIRKDDLKLFKYLLKLGSEQTALFATDEDDIQFYHLDNRYFDTALKRGKVAMLSEMIKTSGAGIPFDTLVEKSGIAVKETIKYYQGLSIAGKKRTDWAQIGRPYDYKVHFGGSTIPPLLTAAYAGAIESVEWFLSDAPSRVYKEFRDNNVEDKRIKVLDQAKGGFEGMIEEWLGARNILALHAAIAWNPKKNAKGRYFQLMEYLIKIMPEALDYKTVDGYTPLSAAVAAYKFPSLVALLIQSGANQRVRDSQQRNLVHYLAVPPAGSGNVACNVNALKSMLATFDTFHVKQMLLERCLESGKSSSTPLAYWLSFTSDKYHDIEILKLLLSYTDGEELDMINGAGDLPLHIAVKKGYPDLVFHLISLRPALLHRENADGITPLELAHDLWLQSIVQEPINLDQAPSNPSITNRGPETFLLSATFTTADQSNPHRSNKRRIYDICRDAAAEHPSKRRLVSLSEANEVAKRVVAMSEYTCRNQHQTIPEQTTDEMTAWLPQAHMADEQNKWCDNCGSYH